MARHAHGRHVDSLEQQQTKDKQQSRRRKARYLYTAPGGRMPSRTPSTPSYPPESSSPRRGPRAWGQVGRILHDPRHADVSCSSAAFPRNLFWFHHPLGKHRDPSRCFHQSRQRSVLLNTRVEHVREFTVSIAVGRRGARDGVLHRVLGRLLGNELFLMDGRSKLVHWRK